MKFLALSALTTSLISVISATDINVSEPWSATVWNANETGIVKWNSTQNIADKECEIHLLTGSDTNANLVANFTQSGLIPCNYTEANLYPLPNYPSGQYFIRLGPHDENTDNWGYSAFFQFNGPILNSSRYCSDYTFNLLWPGNARPQIVSPGPLCGPGET